MPDDHWKTPDGLVQIITEQERQIKQADINFRWLLAKIDAAHSNLCPEMTGTWQIRAEHVASYIPTMELSERLPPPLSNDNTKNKNGGSRSLE